MRVRSAHARGHRLFRPFSPRRALATHPVGRCPRPGRPRTTSPPGCATRPSRPTARRSSSPTRATSTASPSDGGVAVPLTMHEAHDYHARLEPRRQVHRLRQRPLRQLRRLRHARDRRRGPAPDLPLGLRAPLLLHRRRQGRPLRRRPPGHRRQPPVPHRLPARALQGPGRRRPRRPGPRHAGRGRPAQPRRQVPHLPRQEGRRERVAQAPHLGHHPRHLGLRHRRPARTARSRPSPARTATPSSRAATRPSTT